MYQVVTILITKKNMPALHAFFCLMCSLAKNLHNAALFRLRNHFTARKKDSLTDNEKEVEDEIAALVASGAGAPRAVISYTKMERLMRVTKNPDFFAGLPMQSAQWVVKKACSDMFNWLKALKAYNKNPENFTGKPQMPKYKKSGMDNILFTNQDAVVYKMEDGRSCLKLPLTKETVLVPDVMPGYVLKQAEAKPFYDSFRLLLTFGPEAAVDTDDAADTAAGEDSLPEGFMALPGKFAALDFGVSNTAALVTNEGSALLYKGGALKCENQWFNKRRAELVSAEAKGFEPKYVHTHALDALSVHRELFLADNMHKISRSIVDFCVGHGIKVLVLGKNKGWKQDVNIGRRNNQNFVSIPFEKLRFMITYKAQMAGIIVLVQEESYTSKSDFLSKDPIPVYGEEGAGRVKFSGTRMNHLYRSGTGVILNADINGAANILRKAIPNAFDNVTDFTYLQNPRVIGFHGLNPQCIPVKRIAAA